MRKYFWILCLCMILLFGCTNRPASDDKQHTAQTDRSISVYNLTYEQYLEFLDSPSVQYLESNTTKYKYLIDAQNNKKIFQEVSDGTGFSESVDEGVFRISNTPVYVSLIDSWGDVSQVQQYLQSNNIFGDIDDVVFLSCYELPCSVGICVESEWYFVTVDEYTEDYQQNIHSNSYVYRLYTYNEIVKKFEISDADLLLNGKKIFLVKMRYNYAEIPILYLFKQLGADIQWNDDTVTIEYNEKTARIYTAKRIIEFENSEQYVEDTPGGVSCFFIQGTEIYLDTAVTVDVLREFDIEMYWSREENVVRVNTPDGSPVL